MNDFYLFPKNATYSYRKYKTIQLVTLEKLKKTEIL